jgi:hypothetical protein
MQGCKSIKGTMHVLRKFTIWILGESMGNGELLLSQLCRRDSGVRCEELSGVYMMATGCWSHYIHDMNFAVSCAEE